MTAHQPLMHCSKDIVFCNWCVLQKACKRGEMRTFKLTPPLMYCSKIMQLGCALPYVPLCALKKECEPT